MNLDDDLMRRAKRTAAEHGITLTRLMEDALRAVLHERVERPSGPTRLPSFGGRGLRPGAGHAGAATLDIFRRLCQSAGAKGNLVPDAYLAALAIESGCEWVTGDRSFARFEGLRWRYVRPV